LEERKIPRSWEKTWNKKSRAKKEGKGNVVVKKKGLNTTWTKRWGSKSHGCWGKGVRSK